MNSTGEMISIIVPSYNSRSTIEDCLASLVDQSIDNRYEIVVVNSANDGTDLLIRDRFPTVRVIQLVSRIYAGTARNIGIKESKGDILAFIDADCTADPDWLHRIVEWHKRSCSAVGGSILNKSLENIFSRAEYPLEILEFSPENPQREVKFLSAANSSFSREIFESYGFFPEIRAGEDLVFCQGLVDMGVKIVFDPLIRVSHHNDIRFKDYLKKQRMHGEHSCAIRKMRKLSGSFLNKPYLLPLLLPALPFIRALRVLSRSLQLGNGLWRDILRTFPLFFLGCVMWSMGYAKGYFTSQEPDHSIEG